MAEGTQKWAGSEVVRIWREPKERLEKVREAKEKKEKRPVSETELVSKAVEKFCDKEEPKLGIS
jgi:hypothetical protein